MEIMRFFGVSVLGLLLDIAIAFALATLLGLPLWMAAAIGFVIAASANYVLHEIWTFKQGSKALSRPRALKYLSTSFITLLARIGIVALLETTFRDQYALAILLCGRGDILFRELCAEQALCIYHPLC